MTQQQVEYKLTFGSDPEFFIVDKKGIPKIACGLIGGKKGEALKISENGGILEDNVAVEFNPTAATSGPEASATIMRLTNDFRKKTGFEIFQGSEWEFPAHELAKHPTALQFGCDPDFDAYDGGNVRERIDPKVVGNWRFCGGHIHIGIDPWPNIPKHIFIQFLDYFAYCNYAQFDVQPRRGQYYGLPGLFRPKAYGVEYRTPSNFWATDAGRASKYSNFCSHIETVTRKILWLLVNERSTLTAWYRSIDWPQVKEAFIGQRPRNHIHNMDQYAEFSGRVREWWGEEEEKRLFAPPKPSWGRLNVREPPAGPELRVDDRPGAQAAQAFAEAVDRGVLRGIYAEEIRRVQENNEAIANRLQNANPRPYQNMPRGGLRANIQFWGERARDDNRPIQEREDALRNEMDLLDELNRRDDEQGAAANG